MAGEDARSVDALAAAIAQARARAEGGDLTGARSGLETALATAELRLGRDHPRLAPVMVDLATIARELGNVTEAQLQLRRAYQILLIASGPDHPTVLAIEGRLATLSHRLGEPTDAHDWHLADAGARVLGADHAAVRDARARLGSHSTSPYPPHPISAGTQPAEIFDLEGPADWPEQPNLRSRVVLTLVAVLGAATLLVGALVAARILTDKDRGSTAAPATTPPTTAAPTTTQPTATAAAPTQVRVADQGGSVVITWRDPAAGKVPFVVTGGRIDSAPKPLQTVPPGRTRSIIYGLNTSYNYCFVVTAVYSTDVVASSPRICTHRVSVTPSR